MNLGMRTSLRIPKRYEINPDVFVADCASVQAFPVVKGDDRIRTGGSDQWSDPYLINPGSRNAS